jgi:hypothetical protein
MHVSIRRACRPSGSEPEDSVMLPLTASDIRSSWLNTTLSERKNIVLPDLDGIGWEGIDFLGWRDRKLPQLGYVVAVVDDAPAGLLLRQADAKPSSRAQCSWCADVTLPNDVVLFTAKRVGEAGRRGDTVGTLACAGFECSVNARRRPPSAYLGFDVDAARLRRVEALQANVEGFVRSIRDGM